MNFSKTMCSHVKMFDLLSENPNEQKLIIDVVIYHLDISHEKDVEAGGGVA